MIDLSKSREEIDKIDQEIVRLFEDRMKIATNVAEYKKNTGKKVFDKEREEQKLAVLRDYASNDFNRTGISELFTQIMSMSRKLQYSMIEAYRQDMAFELKEQLEVTKNTKVVFFGEKGSFTEQAMEDYFGKDVESIPANTFKEVMELLKEQRVEYGVLPIENSTTGGITDIYDLLMEYEHSIIGEHVLKIEQSLLGLESATIEDIKLVYSHPQGLLQSAKFLEAHPNMEPKEYPSTSTSAHKIIEDQDKTQAAIASKRAASYYGLKVLQEGIQHDDTNSTRFIIISNKKVYLKNANKVSICFELPHKSGSLYNMLSHFIYNNLNMTKIESRPIMGRSWEYRFFIDFEGNLSEAGVKNALGGIKEEAASLRILGNFVS